MLIDEKEVINMPYFVENFRYAETHNRKADEPDKSFCEIHEEVRDDFAKKGIYYPGDFGFALDEYLSVDAKIALTSDNWLVRMLAIMDRRIGKRTLEKVKPEIANLPEWLRYFYYLRLQSENMDVLEDDV